MTIEIKIDCEKFQLLQDEWISICIKLMISEIELNKIIIDKSKSEHHSQTIIGKFNAIQNKI